MVEARPTTRSCGFLPSSPSNSAVNPLAKYSSFFSALRSTSGSTAIDRPAVDGVSALEWGISHRPTPKAMTISAAAAPAQATKRR